MEEIKFYHEYEENGYLGNYYLIDITIDNVTYKSVEHYYQSQKTLDRDRALLIMNAETCDMAKTLGNCPDLPLRPDWPVWKIKAMEKGLKAKFSQHGELQKKLLSTGSAILMENSMVDYFWGIGEKGNGENMLGKLLMELREEIRTGSKP